MALNSYNSIVNAMASGSYNILYVNKQAVTALGAGTLVSNWGITGTPVSGVICAPTSSGTIYISHVTGGIIDNDVAPRQRYLLRSSINITVGTPVIIYDRLIGVSTQLNTVGAKPLDHFTLPRYPSGAMPWLEFVGTTANFAAIISLSGYTNQDGIAGRIGPPFTLASAAIKDGYTIPLPLATGDIAVQKLGSLQVLTATTGGLVNVILIKPLLVQGTLAPSAYSEKDLIIGSADICKVYDGATLGWFFIGQSASAYSGMGSLTYVYG